jgi:predicted nucleic acid-binding protein
VTLKLDAEILKQARVLAAERGSSVSRMLAEKLEELVTDAKGYQKSAKARYRVCPPVLTWAGKIRIRGTNYMSGKCFVDTDILAYAHDITLGVKHERARELVNSLWETQEGILSTQVLQELCVTVRRKAARPLSSESTEKLIEDYLRWPVVVNTAESELEALDLETRCQISFCDALMLQAAAS